MFIASVPEFSSAPEECHVVLCANSSYLGRITNPFSTSTPLECGFYQRLGAINIPLLRSEETFLKEPLQHVYPDGRRAHSGRCDEGAFPRRLRQVWSPLAPQAGPFLQVQHRSMVHLARDPRRP